MNLLKQSTAVTIPIGPFVDATDGFTAETALTLAQADFRLSKNGAAFAQKSEATTAAHMENGWYGMLLDATDVGTLGKLCVNVVDAGARPVYREYTVVPANVYDSLVLGTDKLDANVAEWLGTAPTTPGTAGVPNVDVARWINVVPLALDTQRVQTLADDIATTAKASVRAELHAEIQTVARTEPAQGVWAANASLGVKVDDIHKAIRNKRDLDKDTGIERIYNDDGVTVDHKRTVSDNGTIAIVGEIASGP